MLRGKIPTPKIVEIFPANFCCFECPHCRFKAYHGDNSTYMDMSTLRHLLDELHQRDVRAIELSGGGEPLVHPQVEEIFDYLIQRDFRVGLITNGYMFVNCSMLKEKATRCCNWIRFSVNAFTDKTYKRVHGREDVSYRKLMQAIGDLINMAGNTPKIGLKILISRLNAEDSLFAIDEALRLGIDYLQFKFLEYPTKLILPQEESERLTKVIQEQINSVKDQTLIVELVSASMGKEECQKCRMTFSHPVVDWNGEIYVCAFFEHRKKQHSLGNLHDGGFFKQWDSPYHKQVFDAIDPKTCIPNCAMLRYDPEKIGDSLHNISLFYELEHSEFKN